MTKTGCPLAGTRAYQNPPDRGSALPRRSIAVRFTSMSRSAAMNRGSRSCRYCCKSPKLPGANFSAVKKIQPTTASRCGLNHVTEVASEFIFRRMRSPTSLHESRAYSQKKF